MLNSAALQSLRATLELLPTEWVLWMMDSRGVFLVHEGPGLARKGVAPGETLGQSVWRLHAGDAHALDYVERVLREPSSAELEFNRYRFQLAGGPVEGGGAMGLALALGPIAGAEADSDRPAGDRSVIELTRAVPEVAASKGDLLVMSYDDPEHVGIYRQTPVRSLPAALRAELGWLSGLGLLCSVSDAAEPPAGGQSALPPADRAPHLHLLP